MKIKDAVGRESLDKEIRLRKMTRIENEIAACDFLQGKLDDPIRKDLEILRTFNHIREIVHEK